MVFDFFQQTAYAVIFFLGIAGIGLAVLKALKVEKFNSFLNLSIAFFVSLCLYTIVSIYFLFIVENKRLFLTLFTLSYFWGSFVLIFLFYFKKRKLVSVKKYFKDNWIFLVLTFLVIFVFFLQIYQTSILDEWLHRPVVKFFVENGIFPLKSPYSQHENFIYSYHYGTHIDAAAIQLVFKNGISESLDIFKMSYAIGSLFLFYGIILSWTKKKSYAIWGSILSFFCGGSFFFMDGFSIARLWKIGWIGKDAVQNVPLALSLTGITYVNIPILVAFVFLILWLFKEKKFYTFVSVLVMSFSIAGFFIISEFFGVLTLIFIFALTAVGLFKKELSVLRTLIFCLIACFLVLAGIYFSGGVAGNVMLQKIKNITSSAKEFEVAPVQLSEDSSNISYPSQDWIFFRSPANWGYPSEKEVVLLKNNYFSYFRNFFLEIIFFVIFFWAVYKRKINLKENISWLLLGIFCLLAPFVFSSSTGDLNFAKLTNLGLLCIHLLFFYVLAKINSKVLFSIVLALFVIGSIPGIMYSFSTQWRNFPSRNRINCSQNPLCYKGDVVKFLGDFEKNNPGIKVILNKGGADTSKIVDLTNSYSVVANKEDLSYDYLRKNKIEYILNNLESKDKFDVSELENNGEVVEISNNGKYEILKVNY